jgi:hypothetical protein
MPFADSVFVVPLPMLSVIQFFHPLDPALLTWQVAQSGKPEKAWPI